MSLMAWEGHNNLVGRALNPHNTLLATGGSSSGEGAALGSFSSYLGAATDIAGSIRLPATVCGAYGLKPSGQRFPFSGSRVLAFGSPSESAVPPVHGPVARSVADLELYAKAFINPAFVKYDHNVLPIPWREVTLPQKLKIGYFVDNGACLPAPPVRRMMAESIEKLKAAGHELIPFTPVDVMGMFETCFAFFDAWYGDLFQVIGPNTGDPFISAIAPDLDPRAGLALTDPKVNLPMNKNWELYVKKQIALHIWTQQFLSLGLDAIVCPTAGVPAPPHEKSGEMTPLPISYTCAINLLDWTAGTIPALTVTQSDLTPYTEQPRSEKEAAVFKVYNENLDKYLNAKCGLQVIGRRLEEEKVLAVMKVVDAALKA